MDNTAALDVQIQAMLKAAAQLADAADGSISLRDGERLQVRYACGSHEPFVGQYVPEKQGLFSQMLATEQLVYMEDYQKFSGRLQDPYWQNLSTVIMLPLKLDEGIIGGLTLSWKNHIRPMTLDEQAMLQQYADLATIAFRSAHLRNSLQIELEEGKLLHEKISRLAFQDALTQLPNRAALMERLETELNGQDNCQRHGAVIFIDLDELKGVNDNFGHFCGDEVIVAAGKKLAQTLREYNAFVARLGGDEFIALLPNCYDEEVLTRIADQLVAALCADYPLASTSVRLSASLGITVYPQDGDNVEAILKNADNAMYAAKAAGRNCWRFFESDMLREAQEKSTLIHSLRHALEKNELSLVYQPQVALQDGKTVGFEALMRWNSDEHGAVPPVKFISLAEQSQLIIALGEWGLTQACLFIKKLTELGHDDVRVAVNLSAHQLADERLVERVARVLRSTGVAPARLELEITESALLPAPEESCAKLYALRALGVSLALDDFGTGFSSLTHLRLFPVETLKIDKSFIENIPGKDNAIVDSLIRFAQSLNMKVVAEGVETTGQRDYLGDCGCEIVQGYFYSRPLSERAALSFLDDAGKGAGDV